MIEQEDHSDPIEELKAKYLEILKGLQEQVMMAYDNERTRTELRLDREQLEFPDDLTKEKS